jgi:hypothetical protein
VQVVSLDNNRVESNIAGSKTIKILTKIGTGYEQA